MSSSSSSPSSSRLISLSAGPSKLPPFQKLPVELRRSIYRATCQARVITLSCELSKPKCPDLLSNGSVVGYYLDGDHPYKRVPWCQAKYTAYLYPHPIETPAAFSISKESRRFAFECGYRAWKFDIPGWGIRTIMWDPEVDTILFEKHPFFLTEGALDLFTSRHPQESLLAQCIAVKSTLWKPCSQRDISIYTDLFAFQQLREFVVVIEKSYEEFCSMTKSRNRGVCDEVWSLPQDIECSLSRLRDLLKPAQEKEKVASLKSRNLPDPKVRIVHFEKDITRAVSLVVKTRGIPEVLRG